MKNANPVWARWLLLTAVLAMAAATPGCARDAAPAAVAEPKTARDYFPIAVGGRTVRMQLAVTLPEMQAGLMGRRDLPPDGGMVFVYDTPRRMSFWMRNTPTPLDIGFFTAKGVLVEVHQMYPFDETPVQSVGDDYHFAVETNQGWFRAQGVKPGATLDLKALAAALRERGFDPRDYGLAE